MYGVVESLNSKVDICVKATSYHGLTTYGQIMVGDHAFEFYNDNNKKDYIQIPWEEVDYVTASVLFKGKKIPRYAIVTKKNGTFSFASRQPKAVLRAVNQYIPGDKMLRSLNLFEVIGRRLAARKEKRSK